MEKPTMKYDDDIIKDQSVKPGSEDDIFQMDDSQENPVLESLLAEGGENFYHYITWLGVSKDPNMMILSSIHHYYYDFNDLKGVKILVNLKKLNQINHIDTFITNVIRVLPEKAKFIGCFQDNKIRSGLAVPFYQSFKFLNSIINIFDSRTDRFMSRKDIIKLLESHDFGILDITEISSITYFCAENHKKSA
jgi:hypothetical protein